MSSALPPRVSDIAVGMVKERREASELRRLILIGSLLAHSVRECAQDNVQFQCNADRAALADEWDKQLLTARPHLLRAEAPEKKR